MSDPQSFQVQGGLDPDSLIRGTLLGLHLQTPVIGLHFTLAMVRVPPLFYPGLRLWESFDSFQLCFLEWASIWKAVSVIALG